MSNIVYITVSIPGYKSEPVALRHASRQHVVPTDLQSMHQANRIFAPCSHVNLIRIRGQQNQLTHYPFSHNMPCPIPSSIESVGNRMNNNRLLLIEEKTEFMVFTSRRKSSRIVVFLSEMNQCRVHPKFETLEYYWIPAIFGNSH